MLNEKHDPSIVFSVLIEWMCFFFHLIIWIQSRIEFKIFLEFFDMHEINLYHTNFFDFQCSALCFLRFCLTITKDTAPKCQVKSFAPNFIYESVSLDKSQCVSPHPPNPHHNTLIILWKSLFYPLYMFFSHLISNSLLIISWFYRIFSWALVREDTHFGFPRW